MDTCKAMVALLCLGTLSLSVFYMDALHTDWSGVYVSNLRQTVACNRYVDLGGQSHRVVDAGHRINHTRAYVLPDSGHVALLMVCSACNCPMWDGSLFVDGEMAGRVSRWQSSETGDWGNLSPYDIFLFVFQLSAGSLNHIVGQAHLLHLSKPTDTIATTITSRPQLSLRWTETDSGTPGEAHVSEVLRSEVTRDEVGVRPRPEVLVCARMAKPGGPGPYFEQLASWANYTVSLGADALLVYLVADSSESEVLASQMRQISKGLSGVASRVSVEVEAAPWLSDAMRASVHNVGHLWFKNACLYSSKMREAKFMLYLDVDDYLTIGSFPSLAAMAQDYDAVSISSVRHSLDACFGSAQQAQFPVQPVGLMQCRLPHADCFGLRGSDVLLSGMEQHCLGSRGRRKNLLRVAAHDHTLTYSADAAKEEPKVWHASEDDGVFIRHFQGLLSPDTFKQGVCQHREETKMCIQSLCQGLKPMVDHNFTCVREPGWKLPR